MKTKQTTFNQDNSIERYASAGIAAAERSVCPSVSPSHSGIGSKRTARHDHFFHRRNARTMTEVVRIVVIWFQWNASK